MTAMASRCLARRALVALAGLFMATVAAACGIDAQESAQPINPNALGGLDQTVPPATDLPGQPTAPSTTTANVPASTTPDSLVSTGTKTTTMYFIQGPGLVGVPVDVPVGLGLSGVLARLATPPADEAEAGIRSAIPEGLILDVTMRDDRATIDFDPTLFQGVSNQDRPLLIGQVVLTVSDWCCKNVRFTLAGEALQVLRRNNSLTNPGEYVTAQDYEQLVVPED